MAPASAVGGGRAGRGALLVAVEIDERFDADRRNVPTLLRAARADWCALSWLCWSVGQDRIAIPARIAPPPEFAAAASMSVARTWRAHDRLTTGGLIAKTRGIPGFLWEGLDIDEMPAHFVLTVAEEYTALRSMFLWLVSAANLSPFQSDLRPA